jgi:integrase
MDHTGKFHITSSADVRKAPDGRHAAGRGLFLQVRGAAKSWIMRYMFAGKRRELGLGAAASISLKQALDLASENHVMIQRGVDPVVARREAKKAAKAAADRVLFRDLAAQYIARNADNWSSPIHRAQWSYTLRAFAFPVIGDMHVDEIERRHVIQFLDPIWKTKNETARRLRGRLERIFAFAIANDLRGHPNPADWSLLRDALGKQDRTVAHHAAIDFKLMPTLVADLRLREGTASKALELLVLTAARASEVTKMRWSEVDFADRVWTVPAARMKARKEHRVPLSDAAIELLQARFESARPDDLVFHSYRRTTPISGAAMSKALQTITGARVWPSATVHGMRSAFSTWASEEAHVESDVIEAALAHTIENKAKRAYKRGDLLDRRRPLMTAWADFVNGAARDNVVALRA